MDEKVHDQGNGARIRVAQGAGVEDVGGWLVAGRHPAHPASQRASTRALADRPTTGEAPSLEVLCA